MGRSRAYANVIAVMMPTRNPVNGPGPTPTATRDRSAGTTSVSANMASIAGARISV